MNKLKLNADKTELIVLSSKRQDISVDDILIGDALVHPSHSIRNLGVMFDNNLSMNSHITKVCSVAYFHLRNISRIRNILTLDAAKALTHAYVTSRLDYCNSVLSGVSQSAIEKLQRVQNMSAKMVTKTRKFDHVTPLLKSLHWLPVKYRIQYKVLLFTFRAIQGTAPTYISEMISVHQPRRQLRNSNTKMLEVPKTRLKSAGDRTFAYQSALLWNLLPSNIRDIHTLSAFKAKLKTHLYLQAFNHV